MSRFSKVELYPRNIINKPILSTSFVIGFRQHQNIRSCSTPANSGNVLNKNSDKTRLITTPIFYVNSSPHIGHLYTALFADVLARWRRMLGQKVLFTTGTDEHGLKIQRAAEKNMMSCEDFCANVSKEFRNMSVKANISFDQFIRTTEPRHRIAVNHLWTELLKKGHIYLGKYEGWYCVSDEAFLAEDQVIDTLDSKGQKMKVSAESGHAVEWVIEENYKFKLSSFRQSLLDWLSDNSGVIVPQSRHKEVKMQLEKGLPDLSVSRVGNRIKWGFPAPNDAKQTIYVWLDALTNYLTVTGYPDPSFVKAWPPEYHVIGKDILKFHTIYWPAFLLAAGLELPKKVIAHAHWTVNKVKMSKSLGNVVSPDSIIDTFGLDAVRYFLLSEGALIEDGDFSQERLLAKLKGELADTFGNLVARCTSSSLNPSNSLPAPSTLTDDDREFVSSLEQLPDQVNLLFVNGEISKAVETIFSTIHQANKYFQKNEPWKLRPKKGMEQTKEMQQRLDTILYISIETVRVTTLLLQPIMPTSAERILDRLGVNHDERKFENCRFGARKLNVSLGNNTSFVPFAIPNIT